MPRARRKLSPEQEAAAENYWQLRRRDERNKQLRVDIFVRKAEQFRKEFKQLCKKYGCSITSPGAVGDSRCFIVNGYRRWYTEQQLDDYIRGLTIKTDYVE